MPADRPHSDDASDLLREHGDAPDGLGKKGKALSEPATDFFATWKSPPPVRPHELRSRVWAEAAGAADASEPPGPSDREPSPAPTQPPVSESHEPLSEPGPDATAVHPEAIPELEARLRHVVEASIDEAVAAAGRTIAASLAPALSRLPASIEDRLRTTVRSQLASFAAEQGRVVRELRDAIAHVEEGRLAELRAAIAQVERAVEELKPPEDAPEPAAAVRLEEGFSALRQQLDEVGPEVGRPLRELREAVLAKLASDDQVPDALGALSERLAALEERGVVAVEEPLRELRREMAHDLGALAARVETGLAEVAGRPAMDVQVIREAVAGAIDEGLAERLGAVRDEITHEVSSQIAAIAGTARTAVGEARFARSQLAQAVKAMEKVVSVGDESAE